MTLQGALLRLMPDVPPGRAFAPREWRTLAKVAAALLEGSPVQISPEAVADNVETFLVEGRSRRAWRVRALMTVIEWYPVGFYRKRTSHMTDEECRRMISERWVAGTGVWAVCAKARLLVYVGAYGDAGSRAATGYVPFAERGRARRRVA